jgi:hypothetical protein
VAILQEARWHGQVIDHEAIPITEKPLAKGSLLR